MSDTQMSCKPLIEIFGSSGEKSIKLGKDEMEALGNALKAADAALSKTPKLQSWAGRLADSLLAAAEKGSGATVPPFGGVRDPGTGADVGNVSKLPAGGARARSSSERPTELPATKPAAKKADVPYDDTSASALAAALPYKTGRQKIGSQAPSPYKPKMPGEQPLKHPGSASDTQLPGDEPVQNRKSSGLPFGNRETDMRYSDDDIDSFLDKPGKIHGGTGKGLKSVFRKRKPKPRF